MFYAIDIRVWFCLGPRLLGRPPRTWSELADLRIGHVLECGYACVCRCVLVDKPGDLQVLQTGRSRRANDCYLKQHTLKRVRADAPTNKFTPKRNFPSAMFEPNFQTPLKSIFDSLNSDLTNFSK